MFTVALTGGIASGKSAVEQRFAARGIEIVDADLVARDVVAAGSPALAEIVQLFGPDVLDAEQALDRAAMRRRVFADPDARKQLETIIHPRVRSAMQKRATGMRGAYTIFVIPLFVESGEYAWVDRVLVVDVPRELQIERLLARDGITLELAEAMLASQASREQRLQAANDVIDNSGGLELLDSKVEDLHQRYLALAAKSARPQ